MRALRKVLLMVAGALVASMALAASATAGRAAFLPPAIQTTSYVWVQPPAWVGVLTVVPSGPQSTSYVWPQPPSWVPTG